MIQTLISVVLGVSAFYWVYAKTLRRANQSVLVRRMLMARTTAGVVVGSVIALLVPRFVPETSGSPASLVVLIVLWTIGGVLITLSAAALAGAYRAKPSHELP